MSNTIFSRYYKNTKNYILIIRKCLIFITKSRKWNWVFTSEAVASSNSEQLLNCFLHWALFSWHCHYCSLITNFFLTEYYSWYCELCSRTTTHFTVFLTEYYYFHFISQSTTHDTVSVSYAHGVLLILNYISQWVLLVTLWVMLK